MANCGFKIIKDGSNFVVGINHDQSSFSDTTYALNVNGLAAFYGNPRIFGVQYPGFIYYTRATNTQAVGEQFMVCVTSGNYYSPRQHGFRTYTYNSSTGAANSSYHETYYLPTVDAGRTNSSEFSILTSKNAVTIAQGGTGKTTATEAWTALGGGASGKHADSYFALASHNHAAGDITSGTLPIARGGTNATTAANARTQLGLGTAATHAHGDYVAVTGDQDIAGTKTFTGYIDIKATYPYLRWVNASSDVTKGFIQFGGMAASSVSAQPVFYVYQYAIKSDGSQVGYYDRYALPAVSSSITTHGYYNFLTSKNAVTIAQGGTGKTTATEAWTALGGGASGKHADSYFALADHNHAAGDITSGTLGLARGGTGATTAALARTSLGLGTAATHAYGDFVQTANDQSIAGTKTFTGVIVPQNTVKIQNSSSPGIQFYSNASGLQYYGSIFFNYATTSTYRRPHSIYFREFTYNSTTGVVDTSKFEDYHLPVVSADRTAVATYDIWTTKNYYATSSTALTYVTNSHCDATNLGYVRCDRSGRVAVLSTTTALYLKAYSSAAWIQIGTVPAGYRPAAQVTVRVPLSTGNYMVRVTTAGAVQVYKTTNETSNAYFSIPWRIA